MGLPGDPVPTRAIIDASSAILLAKAGLIRSCCGLFRLLMTRSVFEEVTVPRQAGADGFHALVGSRPGIVLIDDPGRSPGPEFGMDLERLHRGERNTLVHYLNGQARFVIIDDGKGVQVCRRYAIPHVNALLIPKLLHHAERLSAEQAGSHFRHIRRIGRYSDGVAAWAGACGPSDLEFFIVERR